VSLHFLGWVSAAYSAGQAMSAPMFGLWSQKRRNTRLPVSVGMVLTAIGNLIYANLHRVETDKVRWVMIGARFVVGFGAGELHASLQFHKICAHERLWENSFCARTKIIFSGTLGVLRAYVATASAPADRSRAVALGFASFVLGMAVGPALQVAKMQYFLPPVQTREKTSYAKQNRRRGEL
jgi:MFS family permease